MISGFLSGLLRGYSDYSHEERLAQRKREDDELSNRRAVLDSIWKGVASGDVDPRVYGQALKDSMAIGEQLSKPRKRAKGAAGFFGASEIDPSPLIEQLMRGEVELPGAKEMQPSGMSAPALPQLPRPPQNAASPSLAAAVPQAKTLPQMPAFAPNQNAGTLGIDEVFISPDKKAANTAAAKSEAEIAEARKIAAFMQTPEYQQLSPEGQDAIQRKLTGYSQPAGKMPSWGQSVPDASSPTGYSQAGTDINGMIIARRPSAPPNLQLKTGAGGSGYAFNPRTGQMEKVADEGTLHIPPPPQAPSMQFLPTPDGYFAVNPKSGEGAWVLDERGMPVLPNRQSQDLLSSGQETEMADMETLLRQITDAQTKGFAAKWGGVGGFWQGNLHNWLRGNLSIGTDEEADLRTAISNIFGTLAKLRGGTALTAQEKVMIERYTPTINETPVSIQDKLRGLQGFLRMKRQSLLDAARGSRQGGGRSGLTPPPAGGVPQEALNELATAKDGDGWQAADGSIYQKVNGAVVKIK